MQITTKYHSDRNSGGGRITARVSSGAERGRRLTVHYDHARQDPHQAAAYALARKLGYGYVEYVGTVTLGNVYDVHQTIKEGLWSIESLAGGEREFIDAGELQQIIEQAGWAEFKAGGNHIVYRMGTGSAARVARRMDFES